MAAIRAQRTAEASELVDQMIRLDASRSEGWTLRGSMAMNAFDNLPAAYEAFENALARGGSIYFRLAHDHGPEVPPCFGTLTITGAASAFAGDTGGHRYNWPVLNDPGGCDQRVLRLGVRHVSHQIPAAGLSVRRPTTSRSCASGISRW